jgi:uncharacterized protein YjbJ (UPF0337 family)
MVNQQVLESRWSEIQGKLCDHWGQLNKDELRQFDGTVQQLVGLIQRKTGEAREKIERFLEELTNGTASAASDTARSVREYAGRAAENLGQYAGSAASKAQEAARQAATQVRAGYEETERLVRRRPVESLAVCFGAGLITGVVVGLVLRSR